MGFFDRLFGWNGASALPTAAGSARYPVQAFTSYGLSTLPDFMRGGINAAGVTLNNRTVLRNASVSRCINLVANSVAMLPLHLWRQGHNSGDITKASEHPLYDVLAHVPNHWQTSFEFRRLMQHRTLVDGNGYALVIRSGNRVARLIPLPGERVRVEQEDDWTVVYRVRKKSSAAETVVSASDMFHLRGPSVDGVTGLALVDVAAEVLGLATAAQQAAGRLYRNGVMAGGVLQTDQMMSEDAFRRLKEDFNDQYVGADNAGKPLILEEGLKWASTSGTAKDSQNVETRQHQIEEIARIFGVPRPFLMVDDTSWGSGIEQLGIFFVQYGLAPWFVAWEQAISRTLLTAAERRTLYPKFNERALMRGSMKDQAEYFAKALGSGGGRGWHTVNEVREFVEAGPVEDGNTIPQQMGASNAPPQP